MDQLKELSLGQQLILGAGVLLLIDTFLDWQHVSASVNVGGVSVAAFSGGQSAWHGFWGFVMCLMLITLLVGTAAQAFGWKLPAQVPGGTATLVLGILIPVFALLKAITDSYVHWPAWVGVILGAVIAYGAWLVFSESGEKLPAMPARDTPAA